MSTFGRSISQLGKIDESRKKLVMDLVNGFDFAALRGTERHWLRRRRLVLHHGEPTDKGRAWARELLAAEADILHSRELENC